VKIAFRTPALLPRGSDETGLKPYAAQRPGVVLDKSEQTEKHSSATTLDNPGITTCFVDSFHAIAHDKVVATDGDRVITGSINFTKQADALHNVPRSVACFHASDH
jgi:phosphatidylserine/phosphatidylglycerophosphate/cardiolipin synthase-like enzyme